MFRIYDGRKEFYQWDLDRKLIVDDDNITEVHFCNRTTECALPVRTYREGDLTVVNVPNLILQESFRINVYAYDGEYTKHAARFDVVPRSKPDTYVYTETEIKTWDELYEMVKQIEENGVSDATIEAAVQKYLEENDINVDLTGYATEQYVQEQIANIDIPEVDLSEYAKKSEIPSTEGLATEQYVDEAISNIQLPDSGGKEEVYVGADAPTDENIKIWVDTDAESPVATKEYVQQKIAEAQMDGAEVDLSAYYTKSETDEAINNAINGIEIPDAEVDLSNYYTREEVDALIAESGSGDSGNQTILIYEGEHATSVSRVTLDEEQHAAITSAVGGALDVEFIMSDGTGFMGGVPVTEADGVITFEDVSAMTNGNLEGLTYDTSTNTLTIGAIVSPYTLRIFQTISADYITRTEFDDTLAQLGADMGETFYTKQEVDDKIANQTTDLSNYYTKEEVDAKIPDVSGYQTAEEVQSAISEALSAIGVAEEVSF